MGLADPGATLARLDDLVLVEGDRVSLEFLAELIRAQAGFRADCGTSLSPTGAGRVFLAEGSRFGLYVHRSHPGVAE